MWAALARLPYIPSDGHLRELALTGKDIDAARAERIGLVNDVFDDAEATLAAAHATAAEIAGNSPLVVRGIKDVLDEQRIADVSASLRCVWRRGIPRSCRRRILTEGISAMFAKRRRNSPGNDHFQERWRRFEPRTVLADSLSKASALPLCHATDRTA